MAGCLQPEHGPASGGSGGRLERDRARSALAGALDPGAREGEEGVTCYVMAKGTDEDSFELEVEVAKIAPFARVPIEYVFYSLPTRVH